MMVFSLRDVFFFTLQTVESTRTFPPPTHTHTAKAIKRAVTTQRQGCASAVAAAATGVEGKASLDFWPQKTPVKNTVPRASGRRNTYVFLLLRQHSRALDH
jgi:hypothetical protein